LRLIFGKTPYILTGNTTNIIYLPALTGSIFPEMKVAIFETEHFEAAYPLIRLFDTGENDITVFSYAASEQQLKYMLRDRADRYEWIQPKPGQSKISFIRTIHNEIKKQKIGLLFLSTVSDNFLFYARLVHGLPGIRVIMTVHMVNNLFETKGQPGLRRWVRSHGKKRLLNAVNEFNVLSSTMIPLLAGRLPGSKAIHNIPGAVFEESTYQPPVFNPRNPLQIVIPGSVDDRRRNYDQAFELLSLLAKNNIPATLTFLGVLYGEYGQQILSRCRQWSSKEQVLKWYETDTIDQAEFDLRLNEAHFIFTPSAINTVISDGIEENYGTSISSGNVSDVIRHARPFIVPRELPVDPLLEKSCMRYDMVAEIASFLASAYRDAAIYSNLAQTALESSLNYTIEKVRSRNKEIFVNL
jgi:hypothetical protein